MILPPTPAPLPNASLLVRGAMTPDQVAALNALAGNSGDVTLAAVGSSPNASGASLAGQVLTLQPADGGNPGLVSATTQSMKGQKTFIDGLIARSSIGQLSGDICNKMGTGVAAGSVAFGAKLLSMRAGLGGSEVEYGYWQKPAASGFGGVLTVDGKSVANMGALNLIGAGAGENGILFANGATNGGAFIGIGNGPLELRAGATRGVQIHSGLGAGGSDVVAKIGTNVADASVNGGARLLSVRSGIGGSETEYAYLRKPVPGGTGGVLTVDAKGVANDACLDLRGMGAGMNGIGFGTGDGSYIGAGNGFLELAMQNRLFRFSYNASGFSASPDAGFNFSGSALAIPFMRFAANASHTGKLISALLGASEKFSVDSGGSLVTAGNLTVGSGVIINGNNGLINSGGKILASAGLGVGNTAAATALGSVTKKMEIFDMNQNSLGFIPIYGSIT